ncbi:Nucleotidyltransferase domain protein [compost metagenome]
MPEPDISPKTLLSFKGLLWEYPEIEELVLFGSRATGQKRQGSDIDIYLRTKGNRYEIKHEFWVASGVVPIDIVGPDDLEENEMLEEEIKRDGIDLIEYFGLKK